MSGPSKNTGHIVSQGRHLGNTLAVMNNKRDGINTTTIWCRDARTSLVWSGKSIGEALEGLEEEFAADPTPANRTYMLGMYYCFWMLAQLGKRALNQVTRDQEVGLSIVLSSWIILFQSQEAKERFETVQETFKVYWQSVTMGFEHEYLRNYVRVAKTPEAYRMAQDILTTPLSRGNAIHAMLTESVAPALGKHMLTAEDSTILVLNEDFGRLHVRGRPEQIAYAPAVLATAPRIGQATLNFLTCTDLPIETINEQEYMEIMAAQALVEVTAEEAHLAQAFIAQLVEEARNCQRPPVTGTFRMSWRGGTELDEKVPVDHLRLHITPQGIWLTLVHYGYKAVYSWGFWSPEDDNFVLYFPEKTAWMMRLIAAGIWRDATVVREAALPESREKPRKYERRDKVSDEKVLVLPRIVQPILWATDAEAEEIRERVKGTRTTGMRIAHYRRLPEGWKVHNVKERLEEENSKGDDYWLPPPIGYNFVRSKKEREKDEVTPLRSVTRIICKGAYVFGMMTQRLTKGSE